MKKGGRGRRGGGKGQIGFKERQPMKEGCGRERRNGWKEETEGRRGRKNRGCVVVVVVELEGGGWRQPHDKSKAIEMAK